METKIPMNPEEIWSYAVSKDYVLKLRNRVGYISQLDF